MVKHGDRVDVVLDCVTEQRDGRYVARVYVRHVDAPTSEGGTAPPAEFPGASRNVVEQFLGVPHNSTGIGAYAVDAGPVEYQTTPERFEGVGVTARELRPDTVVMVPVGQVNAVVNGGACMIAWAVVRGPATTPATDDPSQLWWLDVHMGAGAVLPQMYRADTILGIPALGLSMDGAAPAHEAG